MAKSDIIERHVKFALSKYKDLDSNTLTKLAKQFIDKKASESKISPLFEASDGIRILDMSSAQHLNFIFEEINQDLNIIYDEIESLGVFLNRFKSNTIQTALQDYLDIISRGEKRIDWLMDLLATKQSYSNIIIEGFGSNSNRQTQFSKPTVFSYFGYPLNVRDAMIDTFSGVLRLPTINRRSIQPAFYSYSGTTSQENSCILQNLSKYDPESFTSIIRINLGRPRMLNRIELSSLSAYAAKLVSLKYRLPSGDFGDVDLELNDTILDGSVALIFDPVITDEIELNVMQSNYELTYLTSSQQQTILNDQTHRATSLFVFDQTSTDDDLDIPDKFYKAEIRLSNINLCLDEYAPSALYVGQTKRIDNFAAVALSQDVISGQNSIVQPYILIEDYEYSGELNQRYIIPLATNSKHKEVLRLIGNKAVLDVEPTDDLIVYINGIRTARYVVSGSEILLDSIPSSNSIIVAEFTPLYLQAELAGQVNNPVNSSGHYIIDSNGDVCLDLEKRNPVVAYSEITMIYLLSSSTLENFSTPQVDSFALSINSHSLETGIPIEINPVQIQISRSANDR